MMRIPGTAVVGWLACLGLVATLVPARAEKFKYDSGPQPTPDTALAVARPELEPIVRSKGPRVPMTNLQLVTTVANVAFSRALQGAPIDSGAHVMLAPAESHPLNFVVEHAVLRHLSRLGVTATVRRSIIPDDSLSQIAAAPGDPVLEYHLASARITYLRLVGWLPGRVKVERQALVEGGLTLREPRASTVLWIGDASHNLVDAFPRGQLSLVEDSRWADLKGDVPGRTVNKVLEPVVVVVIVAGLVALFFQNRP